MEDLEVLAHSACNESPFVADYPWSKWPLLDYDPSRSSINNTLTIKRHFACGSYAAAAAMKDDAAAAAATTFPSMSAVLAVVKLAAAAADGSGGGGLSLTDPYGDHLVHVLARSGHARGLRVALDLKAATDPSTHAAGVGR